MSNGARLTAVVVVVAVAAVGLYFAFMAPSKKAATVPSTPAGALEGARQEAAKGFVVFGEKDAGHGVSELGLRNRGRSRDTTKLKVKGR
jgi:hypothetical protein